MSIVALNDSGRRGVAKLISSSHDRPMNLNTVLPWEQGVDKRRLPKPIRCRRWTRHWR